MNVGKEPSKVEVFDIPLTRIHESKSNPRRAFNGIDELAMSIRSVGVLQPITVREDKDGFELIFGARRLRGAKAAGLSTIPALLKKMNEQEVLEAQLVENAQRQDVHPIEEAEGYERLMKEFGYTLDRLAERTGKPKTTVHARLRLLSLSPKIRNVCLEGKIGHSLAFTLTRIANHELQERALNDFGRWGSEMPSVRMANEHIERTYLLRLEDAPFDKDDDLLVEAAGSCQKCPKRSVNQRELFAEIASKNDMCMDPTCYRSKSDASWKEKSAAAKSKGLVVLEGNAAKKAITAGSEYRRIDDKTPEDSKYRPLRTVLGKKMPPVTLVRDDDSGKVFEVVKKSEAKEILDSIGLKAKSPTADNEERQKQAASLRKKQRVVVGLALGEMVEEVEASPLNLKVLRLIGVYIAGIAMPETCKRRGFADKEALQTAAADMTEAQLRGLIFEAAVGHDCWPTWDGYSLPLKNLAKALDVDLKSLEAGMGKAKQEKAKAKEERKVAAKKADNRTDYDRAVDSLKGKPAKTVEPATKKKADEPVMVGFAVTDRVTWKSQANGIWKTKTGKVIEVVPIGKIPKSEGLSRNSASPRRWVSYVIETDDGEKYYPVPGILTEA